MEATPHFAGIDWSWQHHALCIVDDEGSASRRPPSRTPAGAGQDHHLAAPPRRDRVGIERGDGPVVEHLMRDGFEVVVISARQVKSLRARYGSAGNKDDRFDAFVLADALRTDAGRWAVVQPDSRRDDRAADAGARPPGPDRAPDRGAQPAARRAAAQLPRRDRPVQPARHPHQPGVPAPIPVRGQSRVASPIAVGSLAQGQRLLRPQARGRSDRPPRQRSHRTRHRTRSRGERADRAHPGRPPASLREQQSALEARIKEALLAHPDGPIFPSCPAPASSAQRPCSPRSATAAPGSPTQQPSPPRPASRPRPDSPASTSTSPTDAAATNTSAPHSSTGPKTPHAPTPGPTTPTTEPATAAAATPTQHESWPKAGPGSSGAAGTTTSPTTPTYTANSTTSPPARPDLTPPPAPPSPPTPPERRRGQDGAPHRRNDLDRAEHRHTLKGRGSGHTPQGLT